MARVVSGFASFPLSPLPPFLIPCSRLETKPRPPTQRPSPRLTQVVLFFVRWHRKDEMRPNCVQPLRLQAAEEVEEEILDKPYKEGMSAVALLWADTASPLSSTRPRPKQPKEKATKSKPKTKPKKAVTSRRRRTTRMRARTRSLRPTKVVGNDYLP
ncbi:hypothetical protein B0H14DRAFT_2627962 [Mycena olivaceomarginata]|nr:hypothetical protein B0H14DRAFT_2627962 [Mycena olivaceomarginata]